MYQQYFEQWAEMAKKIQEPVQALVELNVKTLQDVDYFKFEEISDIKKPGELLEKHVDRVVENGHKTLDYLQKSFQIIGQTMLGFAQDVKKTAAATAR